MRNITIALLMALTAGFVNAEDLKKKDPPKPVRVPITLLPTGHFLVSVKLNDKGPYKLVFDTGAPTMLINNRIAVDGGVLKKKPSPSLFSPFGGMEQAKIKSFQIGDLKAEDVPTIVIDHPTVTAISNHFQKEYGAIEGIVGFPFFARYRMTVDYQAKELSFTPTDYKPGDVTQAMMEYLMKGQENRGKPNIAKVAGLWGIQMEKDAKDEEAGVMIGHVMEGSAAAKAELKAGDRLLTIDGRWTDSVGDAYQAAGFVKPGRTVPVVVKRGGKELRLMITPAQGF